MRPLHTFNSTEVQLRTAAQAALEALDMLCTGLEWNIENHPTVMNQSDDEALAQARGALDGLRAALAQPDEVARLTHNVRVLTDAVWKACGDDEDVVNATIESQGELK